jgi:hypothetical protein
MLTFVIVTLPKTIRYRTKSSPAGLNIRAEPCRANRRHGMGAIHPVPFRSPHHQPTGTSSEGMGEVVNLRKTRKKIERQNAEQTAAANRVLHGRSKAERTLDAQRKAKSSHDLERHRIETGDDR